MWVLFVIVVALTDVYIAAVDRYADESLCLKAKEKFEQEFRAAYPGDRDWTFTCLLPPAAKE